MDFLRRAGGFRIEPLRDSGREGRLSRRPRMLDLVFLVLGLAGLGVCALYAQALERL
jgi:hypothetical protein